MAETGIEILDNAINAVVVKLPGRKFPGIVIQGDSLSILFSSARELKELCEKNGSEEALDLALDLFNQLSIYIGYYEAVLTAHGIEKPYPSRTND